jgi:hypothetical protein
MVLYSARTARDEVTDHSIKDASAGLADMKSATAEHELPRLGLVKQRYREHSFSSKGAVHMKPSQQMFHISKESAVQSNEVGACMEKELSVNPCKDRLSPAAADHQDRSGLKLSDLTQSDSPNRDANEHAPVEIIFEASGIDRLVTISHRPLGAEFAQVSKSSQAARISKLQPHGYAAELGLRVGWIVKSVDGINVTGKTFKEIHDAVRTSVSRLPETKMP